MIKNFSEKTDILENDFVYQIENIKGILQILWIKIFCLWINYLEHLLMI